MGTFGNETSVELVIILVKKSSQPFFPRARPGRLRMKGLFSGGENSLSHINAGAMFSLKNVSILCGGESGQATRINHR